MIEKTFATATKKIISEEKVRRMLLDWINLKLDNQGSLSPVYKEILHKECIKPVPLFIDLVNYLEAIQKEIKQEAVEKHYLIQQAIFLKCFEEMTSFNRSHLVSFSIISVAWTELIDKLILELSESENLMGCYFARILQKNLNEIIDNLFEKKEKSSLHYFLTENKSFADK